MWDIAAPQPRPITTRRSYDRRRGTYVRWACGLGLLLPGLVVQALEGSAAEAPSDGFVTIGQVYTVKVYAKVARFRCHDGGCNSGSNTWTNEPLPDGVNVDLVFTPAGAPSDIAHPFIYRKGKPFIPPASGTLALGAETLSPEDISLLESSYAKKCRNLEIERLELGHIEVIPGVRRD